MAASNILSTVITAADAVPVGAPISKAISKGEVFRQVGFCAMTSGDEAASVYRFARVPSNAVITSIKRFHSATYAGVSNVYDIGVYQTSGNGGAVVDRRQFASGVEMSGVAASATGLESRFAYAAEAPLSGIESELWEVLGSGSDTGREYDLAMTISGAMASTAATCPVVMFIVEYSIP